MELEALILVTFFSFAVPFGSRTAFMGEQPNPWDVLPLQDAMSRHRGAKPPRQCELLGEISLLSPKSKLDTKITIIVAVSMLYNYLS